MAQNKSLSFSILGIAGQTGSGKSTLAKEICRHFHAQVVSFGYFVRTEATKRGLPADTVTLQHLGESLIRELGAQEFASRALKTQILQNKELVIIDGIRHVEIWQTLTSLVAKSTLVYLDISENTRLKRVQERDQVDPDTALRIISHTMEKNVPRLQRFADIILKEDSLDLMVSEVEGKVRNTLLIGS